MADRARKELLDALSFRHQMSLLIDAMVATMESHLHQHLQQSVQLQRQELHHVRDRVTQLAYKIDKLSETMPFEQAPPTGPDVAEDIKGLRDRMDEAEEKIWLLEEKCRRKTRTNEEQAPDDAAEGTYDVAGASASANSVRENEDLAELKQSTDAWLNEMWKRDNRKNNVIVKGFDEGEALASVAVKQLLRKVLNIEIKDHQLFAKKANDTDNTHIVVVLSCAETKKALMDMKAEIESQFDVVIENDMTYKERQTRHMLRKKLRELQGRLKGELPYIDGTSVKSSSEVWLWNERESKWAGVDNTGADGPVIIE